MSLDVISERASPAVYIAVAMIFSAVALSLAWLRVEGVMTPAASQIVTLGMGAVIAIGVLRVLELYAGR